MESATPSLSLLDRPAAEAARLLALRLLDDAAAARLRLGRPDDPEALHDFRVAIRRLRSTLRAWREVLDEGVSPRVLRRLRRLARATGESRDLEVHLAWVAAQALTLREYQRPGLVWLQERLRRRQARAERRLARALERRYAPADARLRRRLPVYRATLDPRPLSAAGALAPLILRLAGELEARLALVQSIADEAKAHEVRIAAKRLRYLLEPFAAELEGAPDIVAQLKVLQDVLGELHDAHVFAGELAESLEGAAVEQAKRVSRELLHWTADAAVAEPTFEEDPRPGLVGLAHRLRDIAEGAYARFQTEWLAGQSLGFFSAIRALAATLTARAAAGREIERKYLLKALPAETATVEPIEIEQGWLPGERLVERVRRLRWNGSESWFRTVKAGTGLDRLEVEEATSAEVFDGIWPLTSGRRVRKRRYRIPAGDLVWEIDQFLDRDLVLAEVELATVDTPVVPPEWLQPYLVREVTGEAEYENRHLAG
jgi:CHAD domain-containing protein/CYTH domain-containing protein